MIIQPPTLSLPFPDLISSIKHFLSNIPPRMTEKGYKNALISKPYLTPPSRSKPPHIMDLLSQQVAQQVADSGPDVFRRQLEELEPVGGLVERSIVMGRERQMQLLE